MNKKAQLFTLFSILLIFLTFVSFEIFSSLHEREVIKTRVSTMNSFLNSIEKNLERQVYISGFRILFLAENDITSTGNYIDVDSFFNEAFFNGSINGNSNQSILLGATYSDLINSINQKAKKINVNITLANSQIEVTQVDPWNVKFSLISDFIMQDREELARWEKEQIISAFIPVAGFEDTLYTVNTYAKVSRKINQTPYEGNYTNGVDISNLLNHVNNNYYSASSSAPSFLNRLEGNFSSDSNGIESFVNIPEIDTQGIPTLTKSDIDYIYFSSNNPVYYSVLGMPSWFRVDNESNHLEKYGVGELAS